MTGGAECFVAEGAGCIVTGGVECFLGWGVECLWAGVLILWVLISWLYLLPVVVPIFLVFLFILANGAVRSP